MIKFRFITLFLFALALFLTGFIVTRMFQSPEPRKKVLASYRDGINKLAVSLDFLRSAALANDSTRVREAFFASRLAYKQIEYLVEYYHPTTARFLNGAPIDEVEDDDPAQNSIPPTGFQVLEEFLFPRYDTDHATEMQAEIEYLQTGLNRLRKEAGSLLITDQHVFDAMRLQVARMVTLGITGFDSPLALYSIPETAHAISALNNTTGLYYSLLKKSEGKPGVVTDSVFRQTIKYLNQQQDFYSFDRMEFIRKYANPLSAELLALQNALDIPLPVEPRAFLPQAQHLFSENAFDPDYYTSFLEARQSAEKIALGEVLFLDPVLSGDQSRSCASCHQPSLAFTDGLVKATSLAAQKPISRNTPTLLNAGLQGAQFYDLRVVYLEDQVSDVIQNPDEMHGNLEKAASTLKLSEEYHLLFREAYPSKENDYINEFTIKNALASYIRSLTRMNSRFDRHIRSNDSSYLTNQEVNGFNVFTGKAKCATCHFIPLFNGTVPPVFSKTESEIIGVPQTADTLHPVLDTDLGKYALHKKDLHKYAFKTTTLRNAEYTAPYMHNGVFKTLEDVVDFYNKGGGAGIGINVPHQTLPDSKLDLTREEKRSLVAFMKSLSDTTNTRKVPRRLPSFPPEVMARKRVAMDY